MHKRLENYLAEVAARLHSLPTARRNEELREIRAHLQSALALHQEQGQTEDQAAKTALAQFGTPEAVGQELVAAWRRGEMLQKRSFWGAAACALALTLLVGALEGHWMPLLTGHAMQIVKTHPHSLSLLWLAAASFMAGTAVRVVIGAISGFAFPKRAVSGTALAMTLWGIYGLGKVFYNFAHLPHAVAAKLPHEMVYILAISSIVGLTLSASLTILSAWAGSRWREKQMRLARH